MVTLGGLALLVAFFLILFSFFNPYPHLVRAATLFVIIAVALFQFGERLLH